MDLPKQVRLNRGPQRGSGGNENKHIDRIQANRQRPRRKPSEEIAAIYKCNTSFSCPLSSWVFPFPKKFLFIIIKEITIPYRAGSAAFLPSQAQLRGEGNKELSVCLAARSPLARRRRRSIAYLHPWVYGILRFIANENHLVSAFKQPSRWSELAGLSEQEHRFFSFFKILFKFYFIV